VKSRVIDTRHGRTSTRQPWHHKKCPAGRCDKMAHKKPPSCMKVLLRIYSL
jgi:hypothetical protein